MQGVVQEINAKQGVGRNGPWILYNVTIDGQKYGAGFDAPACKQGDFVNYEVEQKGQYKNVKNISLASGTPPVASPTPAPAGASGNNVAKGTDWDLKDISIRYQSSRKDALALTTALLQAGALAIPAKKADQADAIMAFVDEVAASYYIKLDEVMEARGVNTEDLIPPPAANA